MNHIQSISNSEFIILLIFKEDNRAQLNIFVYYDMLFLLSVTDLYYDVIVSYSTLSLYSVEMKVDLAINYDICQFFICA